MIMLLRSRNYEDLGRLRLKNWQFCEVFERVFLLIAKLLFVTSELWNLYYLTLQAC